MYLMTRLNTETSRGKRELLGVSSMIHALKEEGFDAQLTNKLGWNILVRGIKSREEEQYIWQLAEELGAFGYVPTEHIYTTS